MEPFQPGSVWLDLLPVALQGQIAMHVAAGRLNEYAVNLAKLSLHWAELVWRNAQQSAMKMLCLELKTDEEMWASGQDGNEALKEHGKMLNLISFYAGCSNDDYRELWRWRPYKLSQVLREMNVTFADFYLRMKLVNDVLVCSTIEQLHLRVHDRAIQQILAEVGGLENIFQRLASLSLKSLCVDGELGLSFSDMDNPTAIASAFAAFISESPSSCQLVYSIRPMEYCFWSSLAIRENYWKSIELLPSATSVVLFYPPPEMMVEKLRSFAALDVRTTLFQLTAVNRLGSIIKAYKGVFRSCLVPGGEGYIELCSLLYCTRLEKLHVTGCWHLLANLALLVKNLGSVIRLELEITGMNAEGKKCDASQVDPHYLPRTSQFFESISQVMEVGFTGWELALSDCKQVLKLIGTRLRRLCLHKTFDTRADMMVYLEELLMTLLACSPNVKNIATWFSWDWTNERGRPCSQESRIRKLANKLDQKQPMLDCENSVFEVFSLPYSDSSADYAPRSEL